MQSRVSPRLRSSIHVRFVSEYNLEGCLVLELCGGHEERFSVSVTRIDIGTIVQQGSHYSFAGCRISILDRNTDRRCAVLVRQIGVGFVREKNFNYVGQVRTRRQKQRSGAFRPMTTADVIFKLSVYVSAFLEEKLNYRFVARSHCPKQWSPTCER